MKRIFLITFFSFTSLLIFSQSSKVLFIGNSITYFNDMPETFESIANSLGDSVEVTMHAPGGTGFAHHVVNANLYALLRSGGWDFVVMQPGTGDSAGEVYGGTPIEITLGRIRTILDSLYTYSPCANVLFYEISNGVVDTSEGNINTYNASMDVIFSNLKYFSDSTQLPLAPVGEAFRTSWNNNQALLLWGNYNDIHPNPKGSYLAACVFYASVFQKPSFGSPVNSGLSFSEVEYFQQLADSLVLNHFPLWNINAFVHTNDFSFESNGLECSFTNLSEHFDSLRWDFGDGTFSWEENPTHEYLQANDYTVKLETWKHGCVLSSEQLLSPTIIESSVDNASVGIYPSPCQNVLTVDGLNDKVFYAIYSVTGHLVLQGQSNCIDVSTLSEGVYSLVLFDDSKSVKYRFVKKK